MFIINKGMVKLLLERKEIDSQPSRKKISTMF